VVAEQVSLVNYFWVDSWSQPGATAPCHIMKQLTRHRIGLTHAALACSWPMYDDLCFDTGVRKGARPGPFTSPSFLDILRSAKQLSIAIVNVSRCVRHSTVVHACSRLAPQFYHETRQVRNTTS
jgi:hypothetical protein